MKSKVSQKELLAHREKMFQLFSLVPDSGCYVPWMGLKLKVYKTVFWPHEDSLPLVNNYKINQGESVLDVCSGSGNVAIMSGIKGAGRVVALEHNPYAVRAAKENVKEYGLDGIVEIRPSDMYASLDEHEKFDVITGNLPFTNITAQTLMHSSMHDTNLRAHRSFFVEAQYRLNKDGRIYLVHSDIGAMDEMLQMADNAGFTSTQIGEYVMQKPHIVFSAFELRRSR